MKDKKTMAGNREQCAQPFSSLCAALDFFIVEDLYRAAFIGAALYREAFIVIPGLLDKP